MDVLVVLEGVAKNGVARAVGEEAELDLGVVGDEQNPAGIGDEGGADFPAGLGADGDILQVGIGR